MSPVALPTVAVTAPSAATPEQQAAAAEAEARLQLLLGQGDINQANAVTAVYGDSGVGKSSLCATAAEYCWTRYHRITEYVAADLGGFGNKLLRLIRLGIVRVYNPQNHIEPFEVMEDLSRGYWPQTVLDPFTGFAAEDVPLIPAQRTEWHVYCPQSHLVKVLANKVSLQGFSLQCPICKLIVNPANWNRVEERTVRAAHHQHVGLRIFDSATALEDWGMSEMANRAAKNMEVAGGSADGNAMTKTGGRVISGKYAFGASAVAHYGFVQNRMPQWIRNARGIPGMVMPPIFTFLELRSTDDTGKGALPIYGPKIAGSAKTSDVPAWVGNCLHASRELNEKGLMEHRLWTVNHIDPGGNAPHLAKTRAEPGSLPPYLADGPDDAPFTKFSLGYFFDQLEQVLNVGSRQDAIDFPDAPFFQPLPVGEDVVMSSRDISTGAIPSQVRMTGAPTAVVKPPTPAVLQQQQQPVAPVKPATVVQAPVKPPVVTGPVAPAKPAQPPAQPLAKVPGQSPAQPVKAAVPPVAQQPAKVSPPPVAQTATPPAAAVPPAPVAPVAPVAATTQPAAPAVQQGVATPAASVPALPGTPIRPPQPPAVRAAVQRPGVPPPPPGRPQPK